MVRLNQKVINHRVKFLSFIESMKRSCIDADFRIFQHMKNMFPSWTDQEVREQISNENVWWDLAIEIAEKNKTVVFSAEQASVFWEVSKTYDDSLDYMLPFEYVTIEFESPVPIETIDLSVSTSPVKDYLIGLLLFQKAHSVEDARKAKIYRRMMAAGIDVGLPEGLEVPQEYEAPGGYSNTCVAVYQDMSIVRIGWLSTNENGTNAHSLAVLPTDSHLELLDFKNQIKNLALCCIGYINCENVYLHEEARVPEKVNRKREAKGKSRLEPYYTCRIRGVNYDSVATGTGAAHGIRYDVRGHFRKLATGKTTWVRPHQRGLQNELYVPKTYKVDSNSKPAWKGLNNG